MVVDEDRANICYDFSSGVFLASSDEVRSESFAY